jgi:hypothetical protein
MAIIKNAKKGGGSSNNSSSKEQSPNNQGSNNADRNKSPSFGANKKEVQ